MHSAKRAFHRPKRLARSSQCSGLQVDMRWIFGLALLLTLPASCAKSAEPKGDQGSNAPAASGASCVVWSLALFHRLSTTLYRDAPGEFSRAS